MKCTTLQDRRKRVVYVSGVGGGGGVCVCERGEETGGRPGGLVSSAGGIAGQAEREAGRHLYLYVRPAPPCSKARGR